MLGAFMAAVCARLRERESCTWGCGAEIKALLQGGRSFRMLEKQLPETARGARLFLNFRGLSREHRYVLRKSQILSQKFLYEYE